MRVLRAVAAAAAAANAVGLSAQRPAALLSQSRWSLGDGDGGEGFIRAPAAEHRYTVIFMHGFADTHTVEMLPNALEAAGGVFEHTRFVLPVGMELKKGGRIMRAWANIPSAKHRDSMEDEVNIRRSAMRVARLIELEIEKGIPAERIAVGGFSQGGAVAYLTAMELPVSLAAVFGIACWCPLLAVEDRDRASWPNRPVAVSDAAVKTPVLHCHGAVDPLIPKDWGLLSTKFFASHGLDVESHLFEGVNHQMTEDELRVVSRFLEEKLGGRIRGSGNL